MCALKAKIMGTSCGRCGKEVSPDRLEKLGINPDRKQSDLPEEQTPIESLPTWKLSGSSSSYDPGVLEGLLDTSFDKYITKKIVRFAYTVSLFSAAALAISSFIGLWNVTGFTQSESALPFLIFVLGFSLVAVLLLLWVALTRLKLESFIALVNISKNTEK